MGQLHKYPRRIHQRHDGWDGGSAQQRVQRGTKRPSGKMKGTTRYRNIASSHTKRTGSSSQGTARSSAHSLRTITIPLVISMRAKSIAAQSSDRAG